VTADPNGTCPTTTGPDFRPAASVASTTIVSVTFAGSSTENVPFAATLCPEIDVPVTAFFTSICSGARPVTLNGAPPTVASVPLTGAIPTRAGWTIGAVAMFWMTASPCSLAT
jgi:hypothetical protein